MQGRPAGPLPLCVNGARESVEAGDVLGHSVHVAIAHSRGDLRHDTTVGVFSFLVHPARAGLERGKLRVNIVGVLAAQARIA